MPEPDTLKRVKERASALVAQDLRSASIVLAHMRELIVEAHRIGHSHRAIHASLLTAGLAASWNTYKSCLVRMKRKASKVPPAATVGENIADTAMTRTLSVVHIDPPAEPVGPSAKSAAFAAFMAPVQPDIFTPAAPPSGSATRVMDALNKARQAATSRDYVQISRDLHRQKQREQRSQRSPPKDRS